MSNPWAVAGANWGFTLLFAFVTHIISYYVRKFLSRNSRTQDPGDNFNTQQKIEDLEILTIPELKKTLWEVEIERMMKAAKKATSDGTVTLDKITLDKMAGKLRHAQYDAEDIIDLIGYHRIERKVLSESHGRLYGVVSACSRALLGIVCIIRSGATWLLQPAWKSSLCHPLRRSEDALPVTTGAAHSDEAILVATIATPSGEAVQGATSAAPSGKPFPVASGAALSFDDFKNYSTSKFYRSVDACGRVYRNWCYQESDTVLDIDYVLGVSRQNLKERIEKIERTVAKKLLLIVASKSAPNDIVNLHRTKITSSSSKREVFGRETLLADVMKKMLPETSHGNALSSGSSKCYSVIGIYGIAGSGKTTLARHVLDHIQEHHHKHFDTLMRIHVSKTFTVDDIFHDMLEQITKDRHSEISDCRDLKIKLEEELRGKRFFLILDDVWVKGNSYQELEELHSPLYVGQEGSKILVTARREDAVRTVGANEPIAISDLDEVQYIKMFMHYALDDTSVDCQKFKLVGEKIAQKLHRSPIAAVTVARQLRGKTLYFWETTAKLDVLNETMGALRWSYLQLDVDIRRCFEYCNIYPRRFKLKKDELVHLWTAQGFVKTNSAKEDMEDVAESYIQELLSCSFLQPEATGYFTIHDLMHELAQTIAGSDCFRVGNASWQTGERLEGGFPIGVCHLFVQKYDGELISEILQLKSLRTLIFHSVGSVPIDMESIFKRLRKLRVLAISFSLENPDACIRKKDTISVPESICQLKHLRCLALRVSKTCRIILPSTITKLYHIQMLDFGECELIESSTADLINLRNLVCNRGVKFSNIGRSILLQRMPPFTIRKEQGYEIKQLRDINKLRGMLWINGLENVKKKEEALEANIGAKKRLTGLNLAWDDDTSCSPEILADVLEGLCPPKSLETLNIWHYKGSSYPGWMVDSSHPKDLKELRLGGWSQQKPPPSLEAFVLLRSLELWYCGWDTLPGHMEQLKSLKSLVIYKCKNIRTLPTLPRSLEEFLLYQCDDTFRESCRTPGEENC